MTIVQAVAQMRSEGLRIANTNEPGWTWNWIDENGEQISWWTTDNTQAYTLEDCDYLAATYASKY